MGDQGLFSLSPGHSSLGLQHLDGDVLLGHVAEGNLKGQDAEVGVYPKREESFSSDLACLEEMVLGGWCVALDDSSGSGDESVELLPEGWPGLWVVRVVLDGWWVPCHPVCDVQLKPCGSMQLLLPRCAVALGLCLLLPEPRLAEWGGWASPSAIWFVKRVRVV